MVRVAVTAGYPASRPRNLTNALYALSKKTNVLKKTHAKQKGLPRVEAEQIETRLASMTAQFKGRGIVGGGRG